MRGDGLTPLRFFSRCWTTLAVLLLLLILKGGRNSALAWAVFSFEVVVVLVVAGLAVWRPEALRGRRR